MPYLRGKLKGELKSSEIRKIVRLHNELSKIKIPPRLDRNALIKFIESKGFKVDHENKKIVNKNEVKKDLTLEEAQDKFPVKPRKKKETKKEEKKEVLKLADKPAPKPDDAPKFAVNKALRKRQNKEIKEKYKMGGMDKILELPDLFTPSPDDVKKACRKMKLKNHPDKTGGDDEKFKAIQESCDFMVASFKQLKAGEKPVNEDKISKDLIVKIKKFMDMMSASNIKKQTSIDDLQKLSDDGVDMYNDIQKTFIDKLGFKKKFEMNEWFNEAGINMTDYEKTEKLSLRRIRARVKVLKKK